MKSIRLRIPGESFNAWIYPDLPPNQAEISNFPFSTEYGYGDRVEFDEDRNVTRLVMTRNQVLQELANKESEG